MDAAHHDDVEATLTGAVTFGVDAYTCADYARAERDKLWRKVWQQVGRVEDLPKVGSYLTYDILDDSIVVVRSAADTFKAHHNVCMHRRHPPGSQKRLRPQKVVRLRVPRLDLRPGRQLHPHPREAGLARCADPGEHPPGRGQRRHLGRLDLDQHGSGRAAIAPVPGASGHHARPVPVAGHALQVAKVADLPMQLEGGDGGVQRDLPRRNHPSAVQQVRQLPRLGGRPRPPQQHRLRRAEGPGADQIQDPARNRS